MTHLQFRVELCRGLRQRTMKGKRRNQTVDPPSVTIPNRRVGKRPQPRQVKRGAETVTLRPKRITVPKLKMHAGPNRSFSLTSEESLTRFEGQMQIPVVHPLKSLPKS